VPVPRANIGSYISNDDYPVSALSRNEEGSVRFRLTVGADGRVTNCVITSTSGSAALDNATCRIMRSRARFTPARSASGDPTSGTVESSVTWTISEPPPIAEPAATPQ
jgi:protein TonB